MAIATATTSGPRVHPAKAQLVLRRMTIRGVAERLGMNEQVVGRQLNGLEAATPRVRHGLVELLGRPEGELFHE